MNHTSYLPGQGLYNFVSEYIAEEAPSPAPAPDPVVITEPVNSINLLLENDKLKKEIDDQGSIIEKLDNRLADVRDEIKEIKYQKSIAVEMCAASGVENDKLKEEVRSMKQEMKVLRSMCGLDRRLKLTKIKEEDLHKYCRGDLKSLINGVSDGLMNYYDQSNKDIVILNKSLFDLEFSRKSKKSYDAMAMGGLGLSELKGNNIIPRNGVLVSTVWEDEDEDGNKLHTFGNMINKLICISYGSIEYELDNRGDIKKPYSIKHLPKINLISYFGGRNHDINEWFKMNITFPKLPDFMKIENMNTIDIDIYKMKGIYIITYE